MCQQRGTAELFKIQPHGCFDFVSYLDIFGQSNPRVEILQLPAFAFDGAADLFVRACHSPCGLIVDAVTALEGQYDVGFRGVTPHQLARVVNLHLFVGIDGFTLHLGVIESGGIGIESQADGVKNG